jgi:hypothetical protein
MYSTTCTIKRVQNNLYGINCIIYSVQYNLSNINLCSINLQYTLYNINLYSTTFTMKPVPDNLCGITCTLYPVQYTLYSIICTVQYSTVWPVTTYIIKPERDIFTCHQVEHLKNSISMCVSFQNLSQSSDELWKETHTRVSVKVLATLNIVYKFASALNVCSLHFARTCVKT